MHQRIDNKKLTDITGDIFQIQDVFDLGIITNQGAFLQKILASTQWSDVVLVGRSIANDTRKM